MIFVSHNMQAIRQLCSGAIWFHEGRIARIGPAADVVDEYLSSVAADEGFESLQRAIADLPPDPSFRLRDVRVLQDGRPLTDVLSGRPVSVEVVYDVLRESVGLHVFIQLRDSEGGLLFETIHNGAESEIPRVAPGAYASTAVIPADFLAPTRYELWVHAAIHGVRTCLPAPLRCPLTVTASGLVNRAYPGYHTPGKLAPLIDWRTERRSP